MATYICRTILDRILNVTDKLAQQGGDTYISSELVLQAMLESKTSAGKLLQANDVKRLELKAAIDADAWRRVR